MKGQRVRAVPVRISAAGDEQVWGVEMAGLNERQRAFVIAAFTLGGENHTAWALAAGYKDNGGGGISVQACRMMTNPKIIAAMREYADTFFAGRVPELTGLLLKVARDGKHKDQVKAITHALGLAGLRLLEEKKVTHEHVVTIGEKWKRVILLAKETGEDVQKLIANLDPEERRIIEAEFQEVEEEGNEDEA